MGVGGKVIGKIIILVAIVAAAAGDLSVTTPMQKAYATSGYDKGYADAVCDLQSCHGHGYDPSYQSGHSDDYCSNYGSGYQAGWNSGSFSSTSNSEGAAIGGNKINGDNNLINQQIIQQQGSGNGRHFSGDDNNNDGGNGQLPRCKILCLGVQ